MKKPNTDDLLTVKEFAERTIGRNGKPVTKQYVYNLINMNKLSATYIGGITFLNKNQLK